MSFFVAAILIFTGVVLFAPSPRYVVTYEHLDEVKGDGHADAEFARFKVKGFGPDRQPQAKYFKHGLYLKTRIARGGLLHTRNAIFDWDDEDVQELLDIAVQFDFPD